MLHHTAQAEVPALPGPISALNPNDGVAVVNDMIRKIGTLQFLSATIIEPRRQVVAQSMEGQTMMITPSLRIFPLFSGKTWGVTALATF